jgi:hypothetical protein
MVGAAEREPYTRHLDGRVDLRVRSREVAWRCMREGWKVRGTMTRSDQRHGRRNSEVSQPSLLQHHRPDWKVTSSFLPRDRVLARG